LKQFAIGVRSEVTQMVGLLDTKMREYFQLLYDDEVLELQMLTTGNAANPNVKDELNTYLRAGDQLVPIGPFCNAGRFRALVLSFVFALLHQSQGTIGVTILDDPAVSLDDEHKARFIDHLVGPILTSGQVVLATHYETFYKDCQPVFSNARQLYMTPRPRCADVVSFEPGDLLDRVEQVLNNATSGWKEAGGNLRIWAERTLATLSAYCPEPFIIFNNVPGSIAAYAEMRDENVATPERDQIVAALRSPQFGRVLHKCAHDEEFTATDVEDGLRSLEPCRKAVKKEIERFKKLYSHALVGRRVPSASDVPQLNIDILRLKNIVSPWTLSIVREAAAAHNGQGIDWDENQIHSLEGYQMVLATADTLSPIVLVGQSLLLDNTETTPANGDLVIVETTDTRRYLRRFWKSLDGSVMLVTANATRPRQPVHLSSRQHKMRRVVGVLFSDVNIRGETKADEWTPFEPPDGWSSNIVGLRIKGTSMEPFVREDQFVLVRKGDTQRITRGMLGCVDIKDVGTVIKRCYPSKTEWVLCSMNPNDVEDPMRVGPQDILHAYPLVGTLFEL